MLCNLFIPFLIPYDELQHEGQAFKASVWILLLSGFAQFEWLMLYFSVFLKLKTLCIEMFAFQKLYQII